MSAPTRRSLLRVSGSLLVSGFLAGCIGTSGSGEETTPTKTITKNPTPTTIKEAPSATSSKVESDYSGPHPIGDLNPTKYDTINTTQNAVSFDLPTAELPKGYRFVRATVAMSNTTTNQNEEYVALIYANRSNKMATNWAVVYIVHPQAEVNFRIGQNVSIGNRTGAYYGNQKYGHLHFVCNNSEYELSGPFTQDQLVQIAQSICTTKF